MEYSPPLPEKNVGLAHQPHLGRSNCKLWKHGPAFPWAWRSRCRHAERLENSLLQEDVERFSGPHFHQVTENVDSTARSARPSRADAPGEPTGAWPPCRAAYRSGAVAVLL